MCKNNDRITEGTVHKTVIKKNEYFSKFKKYYFYITEMYKNALNKVISYSLLELYFFRGNDKGIKFIKNMYFNRSLIGFYIADYCYIDLLFMRIKVRINKEVYINFIKLLMGAIVITPINLIFDDPTLLITSIIILIIGLFFFDHNDYYEYNEEED